MPHIFSFVKGFIINIYSINTYNYNFIKLLLPVPIWGNIPLTVCGIIRFSFFMTCFLVLWTGFEPIGTIETGHQHEKVSGQRIYAHMDLLPPD